jgi:hypothetical protein
MKRLGDAGDAGERRHVERLGEGAVHRVAGAQEAAVLLLGGAVHGHGVSIAGIRPLAGGWAPGRFSTLPGGRL